ncbi:MAG: PorV/PorQ family protein [Elusimicrobia bacterium]|nr:PorV/PorQ family protein [Elusimicrobiota bacterium]
MKIIKSVIKWLVAGELLFAIFCGIAIPPLLAASDTGISAGLLLRISPSAKTSAMAEAVTSLSENLASLDFNPAAISNLPDYNFSFSHIEYFEDVNFEDMKFSTYIQKIRGNIGLTLKYLSSKDVERDERGIGRDEFLNSDTVIGISYARKIYPLNTGITVKYLNENLAGEKASAFAADAGLLYSDYKLPFEIGVSARNFGTKISFGGDKDKLPSELRLGMSRTFDKLLLSADVVRQRENIFIGNLGIELNAVKNFKLRTGYTTMQNYSFGVGFSAKIISIDYSFTSHEKLTNIHRFTLNCKF